MQVSITFYVTESLKLTDVHIFLIFILGVQLTPYLSQHFHVHFGHTINGLGSLNGEVRTWVSGSGRTKGSNCAGAEQSDVICLAQFNDIMETLDVHLLCWRYYRMST